MSNFLSNLGEVLGQQFSVGENKLHSLDKKDGTSLLGDFANKYDRTAQRSYYGEGYSRNDLYNTKPNAMQIAIQEPDMVVLVKKRAFSSLAENYRNDLMSEEDRLFHRTTKVLFQNKAKQIAAYEKLSKIAQVAAANQGVDPYLMPTIFQATDMLASVNSLASLPGFASFKNIIDKIKTVTNLSQDNIYTTWITNPEDSFKSDIGQGTGILEFTTVSSGNVTSSINFGGSSANLQIFDPMQLMRITHLDIEQAIADATNSLLGSSFTKIGLDILQSSTDQTKANLNYIRRQRNANPINFIVNPDTYLGKRVQAIIDNSGIEIKFDFSFLSQNSKKNNELFSTAIDDLYVKPNETVGNDILKDKEITLFKQVVEALYNQLQINKNRQTTQRAHNAETNTLRKKMRLHYGGQLIIQPMDTIHIYLKSKTQTDDKILGGLQGSGGATSLIGSVNKNMMNLEDLLDSGKDSSIEKAVFVGNDFPNWLWSLLRNQFTSDKSGMHIFAGIITDSRNTFDAGTGAYKVSITAADNSEYFDMGQINFKPSVDVFNGALYDPLTPFDLKFNSITGVPQGDAPILLKENQSHFDSVFVRYKSGVYVGTKPTLKNFISDAERSKNNVPRRVFYDPDGMVYKWKEGIGTMVLFGDSYQQNATSNAPVPPLTNDPFAGQDVMNALSLLITGEPYNFATFYKAASEFGGYGRDPMTGQDSSTSYFKNLQSDLKYRNLMYGNFIPFKKLTMDQESFIRNFTAQQRVTNIDTELNDLIEQRAKLQDSLTVSTNARASQVGESLNSATVSKTIDDLNDKIDKKMQAAARELESTTTPYSRIGDLTTIHSSPSSMGRGSQSAEAKLHKRTNFLTRRLAWKVRNNEDVNFFIVDDAYDKDYDIQAFEKSFADASLFGSTYQTVKQEISKIANILHLEVFADTQGHIQVRPPQYNKVPSSVFYRMMRLQQEYDIQLYPQFLEDMYLNQLDSIITRISVLEDELRIYGLVLGRDDDDDIASYFSSGGRIGSVGNSVPFAFISNDKGEISRASLVDLSTAQDPERQLDILGRRLSDLDTIQSQSEISSLFTADVRADLAKEKVSPLEDGLSIQRIEQIKSRLLTKTGVTFDVAGLFKEGEKLLGKKSISASDLLNILNQVRDRISERQKILKIAANAIKNAREGLNLMKGKGAGSLLSPGLVNNSQIPQSMQYMIEDESYDDFGPGSGKRYVIKDYQIKSFTIYAKSPSFTAVEVNGRFGDNFVSNLPSDLSTGVGGNGLISASAVDYDMWRMFGHRKAETIDAPFLTNPQTQCAPFAVSLLNKARKEMHTAELTIIGNEYMQPGEVVYVEPLDRLYYIETLTHSLPYNGTFGTQLTLTHGHMMGEYIPTYLDIVGKVLYKNKDVMTNNVNNRQGSVNSEQHLGTIIGGIGNDGSLTYFNGKSEFRALNDKALREIVLSSVSSLSNTSANYQPQLELRGYCATASGYGSNNPEVMNLAAEIKTKLLTPSDSTFTSIKLDPSSFKGLNTFAGQIKPMMVDVDHKDESRQPSAAAFNLARMELGSNSSTRDIDKLIYTRIVDVWVRFANTEVTSAGK